MQLRLTCRPRAGLIARSLKRRFGSILQGIEKSLCSSELQLHAQVAQLVEQRIENPRVGGSIPPLGTIFMGLRPKR